MKINNMNKIRLAILLAVTLLGFVVVTHLYWFRRMYNTNLVQLEIFANRVLGEAIDMELSERLKSAQKMSSFEDERIKQALHHTLETVNVYEKDTVIRMEIAGNDTIKNLQIIYFFTDSIINQQEITANMLNLLLPPNYEQLNHLFSTLIHQEYPDIQSAIELTNLADDTVIRTISSDSVAIDRRDLRTSVRTSDMEANTGIRGVVVSPKRALTARTTFALVLSLIFVTLTLACMGYLINMILNYHRKNKAQTAIQEDIYPIGQYLFNGKTFRLSHPVIGVQRLTHAQGVILQQLCLHGGETVLRETLIEALWGKKTDLETRSIDTHISSLRKYLKDDPNIEIRKCYGQGYRLVAG